MQASSERLGTRAGRSQGMGDIVLGIVDGKKEDGYGSPQLSSQGSISRGRVFFIEASLEEETRHGSTSPR